MWEAWEEQGNFKKIVILSVLASLFPGYIRYQAEEGAEDV